MIPFLSKICLLCLFALVSQCSPLRRWETFLIVPDVINVAPPRLLQVYFPSGRVVYLGNKLTPTQVKDKPSLYWEADEEAFYTLIMTDPDVPNRKNRTEGEVKHWVVVNIPGNNVAEGETLVEFIGSGPAQFSGYHRYTFLVFKQSGELVFDEPIIPSTALQARFRSSTRAFVKKYNLGIRKRVGGIMKLRLHWRKRGSCF